jgi:hypothetical protein
MKFHVGESVVKAERKIATAGEHVVDVQAAVEEFSEFHKCNVIDIQLSVVVGGFSFVFLNLTPRTTWLAGELADALGIPRIDGDVDIEPYQLVGKRLLIEVGHYTKKDGTTGASVKKIISEEQPDKPAAVRQKVVLASDDIPF